MSQICTFLNNPQLLFFRNIAYIVLPLLIAQFLVSSPVSAAEKTMADAPDFYASFNGTLNAVDKSGQEIKPLETRGVSFVEGPRGKAAFIGGSGDPNFEQAPTLQYSAQQLLDGPTGTMMFWVKPDWDGHFAQGTEPPYYRFIYANPKFSLFMWNWLRWDLGVAPQSPTDKPDATIEVINRSRLNWMRGDWRHIALVWDNAGYTKLFVNGLPYENGLGSAIGIVKRALSLGKTDKFFVGSQPNEVFPYYMRANAAFFDLKIYKRALPDTDVVAEYRSLMPFDTTVERQFVRANQPEKFDIDVWPGGQMTRPLVGKPVATPVKGSVQATFIRDADGSVVAQKTFPLNLSGVKTVSLPLPKLATGSYRAVYKWNHGGSSVQTSRSAQVYDPQKAPPASKEPVKLGAPIATIDCATQSTNGLEQGETKVVGDAKLGAYRESANNRDARFSYEIDFSSAAINGKLDGRPMQIDIYWPDDKPRSMGLYMYLPSQGKEQRDRLEGGIQSGNEYPLSHRTQKTSYLFFPWAQKYLFEARTMVQGMPAAVSKIVVSPVVGRLPKLAIREPVGLQGRSFGHLDEDQSFDVLFAYDAPLSYEERGVKNLEMLLDYLDYTGQNQFSYPFIRYADVEYDLPGALGGGSPYFHTLPGWRSLMLDMFAARGKKVTAIVNAWALMDANKLAPQRDALIVQDYYQRDRNGKLVDNGNPALIKGNPFHPLYRKQFMGHVSELVRRFGNHPAFAGIDLWDMSTENNSSDWQISDLNTGYDDLTIRIFTRETGITAPGGEGDERYNLRYQFLTGPRRKEWLAWRAKKNTEFLSQIVKTIRAVNPKLVLGLSLESGVPNFGSAAEASGEPLDFNDYYYEKRSLDFKALREIPGLAISPTNAATVFRWWQHWNLSYSISDELIYDLKKQAFFRNKGTSHAANYMMYFEAFKDSLKPDTYSALFQNADVKAHGRFFLKTLGTSLAGTDPAMITIGAQPIGTSGRDAEAREFTQAFRTLPVGNFLDVQGMRDPAYVRSLKTKQGTYVYVQNLIHADVNVKLVAASTGTKATDLSSGSVLASAGRTWTIPLKAYQLRSFLLTTGSGNLRVASIEPAQAAREWYLAETEKLAKEIASLRALGADTTEYDKLQAALQLAVKEGRFAETHRLLFSKPVRLMPDQLRSASEGYLKTRKEMVAKNHIAVRAGSRIYYRSDKGTLFFPDEAYTPGGFGFYGSHAMATHDTSLIKEPSDRDLFFTEAFGVQGYRFTLPKGKYTVRLYNYVGYAPSRAPGKYVLTVDIQGKRVWENKDIFLAVDQDPSKTLITDFKGVEVTGNELTVEFQPVNGNLGNLNAIEVFPE